MFAFVFAGACLRFPLFLLAFAFVFAAICFCFSREEEENKRILGKRTENIERRRTANDCNVSENALPVPVLPGLY